MKKIIVAGIGLGESTLTIEAKKAIEESDVLLGAPRMLDLFSALSKRSYPYYLPDDVVRFITDDKAQNYVVLVSGDVGFYSAATKISEALSSFNVSFIPGISTVNAFFAKLKIPWQDARFISAHGREANVADSVRRNRHTFCLTGNNLKEIGKALCQADLLHIKVHVGENLGTEREQIFETVPEELLHKEFGSLTILLFVNELADDSIPCGIPDSRFLRLDKIPMTKSEIRAVVLSKLRLRPYHVCWDVGAGTGSVSIEMALSAYNGHVYAIERREDSIPLIEQNCASFHVGNITTVLGEAPSALSELPMPDAVFIGGSGGELSDIISIVLEKNPLARIVVTAVTIETVSVALEIFSKADLEPEITQINVARGKKAGNLHLMEAQNPITILSAGGTP